MSGQSGQENGEVQGDVAVIEDDSRVDDPGHYAVMLHNDNYTTMEFVIEVLERFFHKGREQATGIMLKVHNEGKAMAGVYSLEIAETKAAQVSQYARERGFPLKSTVEPTQDI